MSRIFKLIKIVPKHWTLQIKTEVICDIIILWYYYIMILLYYPAEFFPVSGEFKTNFVEKSTHVSSQTNLFIYLLTYLLTPLCRVLLEQLTGLQLVKKFPAFHGTPRFITALTSVRHLSLSWASPIQSIYPHPTWRSILILSTHLRLGLPGGLFPSGFPTKTLYTPLSSPIRATCPAHLILLHFITHTILGEQYKSFSSSLCNLLHSSVNSSLLGPNILLNSMFSNTLSSLSCRNFSDQVSHPYKTATKFHTHIIFSKIVAFTKWIQKISRRPPDHWWMGTARCMLGNQDEMCRLITFNTYCHLMGETLWLTWTVQWRIVWWIHKQM